MEKLCLFCQHWQWDGGEPHYSDLTPGSDASMGCAKGHYDKLFKTHRTPWFRLLNIYGPDEFRKAMQTAEACPDYAPVGGTAK